MTSMAVGSTRCASHRMPRWEHIRAVRGLSAHHPAMCVRACKAARARTITAYDHERKLDKEDAKDGSHQHATSGMMTASCLVGILFVGLANGFHILRTTAGAEDSFRVFIRARWPRRAYWLSGVLMVPLIATAVTFSPWIMAVTIVTIFAAYAVGFVGAFTAAGLAPHSRAASHRHP